MEKRMPLLITRQRWKTEDCPRASHRPSHVHNGVQMILGIRRPLGQLGVDVLDRYLVKDRSPDLGGRLGHAV